MKRKTDNFNKFFNRKRNSAVKEEFRQEKKAEKKERKAAIERHFEEKRKTRSQGHPETRFQKPGSPETAGNGKLNTNAPFKGGAPARGNPPSANASAEGEQEGGPFPYDPNLLPLNKYIAHGGICSRRDAAELIRLGKVQVNGKPVLEPGTKVSPSDLVKVNGKKVTMSRNFVYVLLNKPKDYITTTDDPQGRKTVLDLIRQATPERVFPVGRLDRNTSGVLLLTNDGDLAQKLAHPKHEIKKIYHVTLDKVLSKGDFDKIISGGVLLEDGVASVDVLAYADSKDKTQIGLEIHSGRNRIVRRIFEHLGYDVRGLDRVMYAGLTKKNVQRGHWRLLTEKEVRILKYLNSSIKGSARKADARTDDFSIPEKKERPGKKERPDKNAAAPSFSEENISIDHESFSGENAEEDKMPSAMRKRGAFKKSQGRKHARAEKPARPGKPSFADKKASAGKGFDRKGPGPHKRSAPDKRAASYKGTAPDKRAAPHEGAAPDKRSTPYKSAAPDKRSAPHRGAAPGDRTHRGPAPDKRSWAGDRSSSYKGSSKDKRSFPDKGAPKSRRRGPSRGPKGRRIDPGDKGE
jgi:23S rRNA pseudouridine2605 synthase